VLTGVNLYRIYGGMEQPDNETLRWAQSLGLQNIRPQDDAAYDIMPKLKEAEAFVKITPAGIKFLAFFITYQNVKKASMLSGLPEKTGRKLLGKRYVREIIEEFRPQIKELLRVTVNDIETRLWEEATDKNKGSSQFGRLAALKMLGQLKGEFQKRAGGQGGYGDADNPSGHQGGLVLIPATLSRDEWNSRVIGYSGKAIDAEIIPENGNNNGKVVERSLVLVEKGKK